MPFHIPPHAASIPVRIRASLAPVPGSLVARTVFGVAHARVVALLRAVRPLHVTPETFVFTTPTGLPLDTDRFVESRWHRALRATGIRPRKFYATRHTFISIALSRGCKAKWVAQYCGTSLEMLDRHYGRWMGDDAGQLALLAGDAETTSVAPEGRAGAHRTGTFAEPFAPPP